MFGSPGGGFPALLAGAVLLPTSGKAMVVRLSVCTGLSGYCIVLTGWLHRWIGRFQYGHAIYGVMIRGTKITI